MSSAGGRMSNTNITVIDVLCGNMLATIEMTIEYLDAPRIEINDIIFFNGEISPL